MNPELSNQSGFDQAGRVTGRSLIPRFVENAEPLILSAKAMNRIVDTLNAFLCAEIQRGPSDAIIFQDGKVIFQIQQVFPGELSAATAV